MICRPLESGFFVRINYRCQIKLCIWYVVLFLQYLQISVTFLICLAVSTANLYLFSTELIELFSRKLTSLFVISRDLVATILLESLSFCIKADCEFSECL